MSNHSYAFEPPESWVSPLRILTNEANIFGNYISDISTMVENKLEIGDEHGTSRFSKTNRLDSYGSGSAAV
jgi:hypothetical protein